MHRVTISAPASKSLSHRALMLAALATGNSKLQNILESDDLTRTQNCLKALGATIQHQDGVFDVTPGQASHGELFVN